MHHHRLPAILLLLLSYHFQVPLMFLMDRWLMEGASSDENGPKQCQMHHLYPRCAFLFFLRIFYVLTNHFYYI